jgi:hypothetical protein
MKQYKYNFWDSKKIRKKYKVSLIEHLYYILDKMELLPEKTSTVLRIPFYAMNGNHISLVPEAVITIHYRMEKNGGYRIMDTELVIESMGTPTYIKNKVATFMTPKTIEIMMYNCYWEILGILQNYEKSHNALFESKQVA